MRPLGGVIRYWYVALTLAGLATHLRLWLLHPDMLSEAPHLGKDHLPHFRDIFDDFEVEIECCGAIRFVGCIMPDVQIVVFERLLDGDSGGRIKGKHLVQEVKSIRVRVGEELLKRDFRHKL